MMKKWFNTKVFLIIFIACVMLIFIENIVAALYFSDISLIFLLIQLVQVLVLLVYAFIYSIMLFSQANTETYKALLVTLIVIVMMVGLSFLNYYIWIIM